MSDASNDYRYTDQIGHLLRRAYQRHVAIFRETVPDAQLTAAQFVVLCTLRDRGACRIPAIAEATAIDEASTRGIVERLKWRGLVTADHEPGDARRTDAALTPAGRSLVEQTVPIAEQISELTFGDLTGDERRTIVALLRRLCGLADA